ncbi:glutamate racemase [Candidatus Palibaumannia cicadellinicola]|uniref:Glutamate racemase n=1 Tax=Candidatus Palibaumannia cicadellinicola TaxID=186490 RepID=A0A088MXX1_9GAMM|nr:glutamate racemase [Candidatus Baumannia cicadellinicola]AIN47059.1 Glutamate racemase [Candidatus Baumannia cicadellinicola]
MVINKIMLLKQNKKIYPNILILDSGVGGLSIFSEVIKILPNANYIYVFDNEAFPYGEKSRIFIIDRVVNIVYAIYKMYTLNIIIIACNTASILTLSILRRYFLCPIIGVVPAIKLATKLTRSGMIGLLATTVTLQSNYIQNLICKFATCYNIIPISAPELVILAEAKLHGEKISLLMIEQILLLWLKTVNILNIDTIILGCTHFPLLREELQMILPNHIQLIDSHKAIAQQVLYLVKQSINYSNYSIIPIPNKTYYLAKNDKISSLIPHLNKCGFYHIQHLLL